MNTRFGATVLSGALVFLSLALSSQASQKDIDEAFQDLSRIPADFNSIGVVCEHLAQNQVLEEYPAKDFEIVGGIEYGDGSRTIGELDVVVFERKTETALVVAEVKCWKDLGGAIQKARKQITRFQDTLAAGKPFQMYVRDQRKRTFNVRQFKANPEFVSISQMGGKEFGFDEEMPLNIDEAYELQSRLVSCQNKGSCPKPH